MLRTLLFFTALCLLASCGKEGILSNLTRGGDDEPHSYDIGPPTVTCSTGRHTFKGLTAYCSGLQDERANNRCAQGVRRTLFVSAGYPGKFTPFESLYFKH